MNAPNAPNSLALLEKLSVTGVGIAVGLALSAALTRSVSFFLFIIGALRSE